jgi:hypothetical protein
MRGAPVEKKGVCDAYNEAVLRILICVSLSVKKQMEICVSDLMICKVHLTYF